jgi:nucleoside-diphosphate-sugar epimerase
MADALVIGGGGFIGRCLVAKLLDTGRSVRVLGRSAASWMNRGSQLQFLRGDISEPDAVLRAAEGVSEVFHLAMSSGNTWADFERVALTGVRNVARSCRENGVRRLVFAGSIAALYLGDKNTVVDPVGMDPHLEKRPFYARAKGFAERLLAEERIPMVTVRPGVVVGSGTPLTHSGVGYWPSDLCCIGWGQGNNPIPFVLVDDVADAALMAMETPGIEGRSYNLVGDVRPTAREYVLLLRQRARRRFQFYPRSFLRLQSIDIFKWAVKVVARKPENPFPRMRDLKSRSFRATFDCSAAKQDLGWRPNADRDVFIRLAIDSHLRPIAPGDLRMPMSPGTEQ